MSGRYRAGDLRIPTYLSHSYRTEDREVNEFFLELLWQYGFAAAVDPPSVTMPTVHIEQMMRTSACFVGVVTRRDAQARYRCSPFAVYEYGLAVQGHRPGLVFAEAGVPARYFRAEDRAPSFDRYRLSSYRPPDQLLENLAVRGRAHLDVANRLLGGVGLLLPRTKPYRAARIMITELLEQAGYEPVDVPLDRLDAAGAALLLDELDFVILDLLSPDVPSWVFPFVRGRGLPSMKLIYHSGGDSPPAALPPLATSEALEQSSAANQNAIWWSTPDGLALELEPLVARLRTPNRPFGSVDEGRAYFRSLGRASGRVFLSSARADNGLAREVGRALELYNIDYFHYLYHNTIRTGAPWRDRLPTKIAEYPIFVPLLSRHYWASAWCQQEYTAAWQLYQAGAGLILPYFLDHASGSAVQVQGVSLIEMSAAERTHRIVSDLDRHLVAEAARVTLSGPGRADGTGIDIAIIATRRHEYEEVAAGLAGTERPAPQYAWVTGQLAGYQIVLAHCEDTVQGVRATVDAFAPDYVIVISLARSVAADLATGDIVVSERVYGFDVPRPGEPALPRPNWNYPTDLAIAVAARSTGADLAGAMPRVHSGPIAAGTGGAGIPFDAAFAAVLRTWPQLVAVTTETIGVVEELETLRRRGRLQHFVIICQVVGRLVNAPDSSTVSPIGVPAAAADLTRRLIASGWPSPPRTRTA